MAAFYRNGSCCTGVSIRAQLVPGVRLLFNMNPGTEESARRLALRTPATQPFEFEG